MTDGVIVARLCGTARRLSIEHAETEAGLVELQAISTSPVLLARAAGTFMAGHRHDARLRPFDRRAADLLLAAGADRDEAERQARVVAERLGRRSNK